MKTVVSISIFCCLAGLLTYLFLHFERNNLANDRLAKNLKADRLVNLITESWRGEYGDASEFPSVSDITLPIGALRSDIEKNLKNEGFRVVDKFGHAPVYRTVKHSDVIYSKEFIFKPNKKWIQLGLTYGPCTKAFAFITNYNNDSTLMNLRVARSEQNCI